MITAKDKNEFINSLCQQVQPNAHFNIDKPDVEYINFLKVLKNRGLLNYFAEHYSVLYMELAPELYEFMDAGGFIKEDADKEIKEKQINQPQTIILQQTAMPTSKLEGTCTNELIQRKALGYLYKRREAGMVSLKEFWMQNYNEKYIKNTLQALHDNQYIISINHRKIDNIENGVKQTLDNIEVTAKITSEGKEFYRKHYRDDITLYWSGRIGLFVLAGGTLYTILVWLINHI